MSSGEQIPLCIDLDGSLLNSDLFYESILLLIRKNPIFIFYLPIWLMVGGKGYLKEQIAMRVQIDIDSLPFNAELIEFLFQKHKSGRHLVLATGSNIRFAREIADYLGFFDDVIASTGDLNLTGKKKLAVLNERYGMRGFDYVGNSSEDLIIFKQARKSILVNMSSYLLSKAKNTSNVSEIFPPAKKKIRLIIKSMRIHQWAKNFLIFVPLLTSHTFTNSNHIFSTFFSFVIFCFCSSSIYIINDLFDLKVDRKHPNKKKRPFASGELSIQFGLGVFLLLLIISVSITYFIQQNLLAVLFFYICLTLAYSFYLKKIMLLDAIILAILYTTRVIAGHVSTNLHFSIWLLAFSFFLFFGLALLKRFCELKNLCLIQKEPENDRGYLLSDLQEINILGVCSCFLSILVFIMYISSKEVIILYNYPQVLWLICPILLFWVNRVWLLANRGLVDEDPIIFALKDKASWFMGGLVGIVMLLATHRGF